MRLINHRDAPTDSQLLLVRADRGWDEGAGIKAGAGRRNEGKGEEGKDFAIAGEINPGEKTYNVSAEKQLDMACPVSRTCPRKGKREREKERERGREKEGERRVYSLVRSKRLKKKSYHIRQMAKKKLQNDLSEVCTKDSKRL